MTLFYSKKHFGDTIQSSLKDAEMVPHSCHSGLPGIFLQKDSRQAGVTDDGEIIAQINAYTEMNSPPLCINDVIWKEFKGGI
jgi:hypothetical protein